MVFVQNATFRSVMKNMNQFILVLNGPICAGKSTVVELILSRHENLFLASYDKIKWSISQYSSEKHHTVVTNIVLGLAEVAFDQGLSIVADGATLKTTRERYVALAKSKGVKYIEVNMEAPLPLLEERFKQRVVDAAAKGTKISITELPGMMKIYTRYQENKNFDFPTFDSSILSAEQIAEEIEKLFS